MDRSRSVMAQLRGCAGIQVGASEEGRRANRMLLNEQYINYLKAITLFSLYDV